MKSSFGLTICTMGSVFGRAAGSYGVRQVKERNEILPHLRQNDIDTCGKDFAILEIVGERYKSITQ